MAPTEKRAFDLPPEQSDYIDHLVKSGTYASANDVISAGLSALQTQQESLERWLREDVAPVYDAMQENPDRGIPAETVFARLRAHHETRVKSGK
ncbi:CopG/Arc/MetJ family addiction module antidote protein [Agrobacterium albertimagni AOL15]|uniref:CopG/Arc/MetJ family addiction module antidote protein n=1 Tax=Agrobacterium albertimagni AOL15 TaxID=1156935 RepID=K2Q2T6_9HYPH|nr:type II toxin-antitoxin system ParD family antitoxin [Agrobacterium albertimagni]EKF58024.1 CopG/Arc/MetJ family addiction module antidote protein [Agrobacterium albertimagni AOL15]